MCEFFRQDEMANKTDALIMASSQPISIQANKNEPALEEESTSCGLGYYTPRWLQIFASKKAYVLIYGILGMNQAAIGSYFIGTISTIEKRFKLPSSTFGLIASSWDVGVLMTVLAMGYIGTSGHKTKLVAISAVFAALSCFLRYLPHVIFGYGSNPTFSKISNTHLCNESSNENINCSLNSEGLVATLIFIFAHVIFGVGTSTYSTLGAAYLDDNSLKDKAPFLISLATCFRHLGPPLGFLLASYAVSANTKTSYKQSDQRFIGAWYWGWVPMGTVHLFLALVMGFFPKTLPREAQRRQLRNSMLDSKGKKEQRKWSLNDLKCRMVGLMKNRLLMYNAISCTLYMFGALGHRIFLPKYIESQFLQTASRANLVTGTVGIICSLLGVLVGGCIISQFKPHPRSLAAWSMVTKMIEFVMYLMFAFINCEKSNLFGVHQDRLNLVSNCNAMCDCSHGRYSPVCDLNSGTTFFSPCQAGCKNYSRINETVLFENCGCLNGSGILKDGACSTNCEDHFIIFLVLLCFLKFLSATGKSGSIIIQYRSVDPEDKSLSIALCEIMQSCFSYIPAPIIYGFILDSSCLLWEEECGRKGNCLLYHDQRLRLFLNFISAAFVFAAAIFDFGVFTSVQQLNIYDDDGKDIDVSEKLNVNCDEKTTEH